MMHVDIAGLKLRLGDYVRAVRNGETVMIVNRGKPIAMSIPVQETGLSIEKRRDSPAPNEVPLPPPLKIGFDVLELLLEDRQTE